MNATLLSFLSLVALVAAAPNLAPDAAVAEVTPAPEVKRDLFYRADSASVAQGALTAATVTIVNSMNVALSTQYTSNAGNPTLIEGAGTGTVAAKATASFVLPVGNSGQMALVEADYQIVGNTFISLIEPGLTDKFDFDVSYVNGFSVPITCTCDADPTVIYGCSADLWALNACGADGETDRQAEWGACENPRRAAQYTSPSTFFTPCERQAYTYSSDDKANSYGMCESGAVTCCVGTQADGCPAGVTHDK